MDRTGRASIVIANIISRDIIDENIEKSAEWRKLLQDEPEIICARDDDKHYHVDLPSGWGWSVHNATILLKDNNGKVRYEKDTSTFAENLGQFTPPVGC